MTQPSANKTKLVLANDTRLTDRTREYTLLIAILGIGLGATLLFNFNAGIAMVIILGMVYFFLFIFGQEYVEYCELDKTSNKVTLISRSSRYLWIPQKHEYPFDEIQGLTVKHTESEGNELKIKTGSSTMMFGSWANAKTGEAISQFLEVPLYVSIGSEQITYMPWVTDRDAKPRPIFCPKCGAPLPTITPETMHVVCSHCGITSLISWGKRGENIS